MSVRQKIDDSLVTKINELSDLGYSNSKIASDLNVSKEIVYRYKFNLILKEDDLEKLAETIRLSKQGLPLYKIRKIVSVGKPKISTFASQSKRTDVQEKLKEYKINQYSYYEIFKQVQEKPNSVCTDDIFCPLDIIHRYINYNNYQVNALKTYQRPGGNFTIYSTIETDDDTVFIAITGTE
jgi:DNA-binding transcriptional MerR regulator